MVTLLRNMLCCSHTIFCIMNCSTKEQTYNNNSLIFSIFSVGSKLNSSNNSTFFSCSKVCVYPLSPIHGHAYYYHRVDFHFVSDEGEAVEAELNMPRGLEWNRCLIFRGKQTHTGSRHGCHISLSSPVTPEGSGQGQPLRCGDATEIYMYSCRDRNTWPDLHIYTFKVHRHKGTSICCFVDAAVQISSNAEKNTLSLNLNIPLEIKWFDLPSWKAADLVHKPGSIFNFPRLISDWAGAEQLYSFTSARRRFSGFQ